MLTPCGCRLAAVSRFFRVAGAVAALSIVQDTPLGVRLPLGILQMAGACPSSSDEKTRGDDRVARHGAAGVPHTSAALECAWRSCGEVDPTILSSLDYVLSLDLPDATGDDDEAGALARCCGGWAWVRGRSGTERV